MHSYRKQVAFANCGILKKRAEREQFFGYLIEFPLIDISTRIPANSFAGGIVPFFLKRNTYPYSYTEISHLERSV